MGQGGGTEGKLREPGSPLLASLGENKHDEADIKQSLTAAPSSGAPAPPCCRRREADIIFPSSAYF